MMSMQEISDMASRYGVISGNMSKAELIRAIQRAEGYTDCFMTNVTECGEASCLWREDCLQGMRESLATTKLSPPVIAKAVPVQPAKSKRAKLESESSKNSKSTSKKRNPPQP